MVNIETRQNGKFKLGFPYNSSVDEYFKSLPDDFINNYGLSTSTVNSINNHKNTVFQFDKDLHEYLIRLSTLIKGFEQQGQIIINDYARLKTEYLEFKDRVERISGLATKSNNDYLYMTKNINTLKDDLVKVEEMILFYESQIVLDTYLYSETYIQDSQDRLDIINGVISTNETENEYYENSIKNKINDYTTSLESLRPYGGFKEISLRNYYESWLQRSEDYYTVLVDYFRDEYESNWTYGQSLMFGEKKSQTDGIEIDVKNIYGEWKERLFRDYDFRIEKEIKEYSLQWLGNRPTFEMIEFTVAVEEKKYEVLTREISLVEQIIITKRNAVRSVVSYEKETNYLKYMELVQLKRQHIFTHILTNDINEDVLADYDTRIAEVESDYLYVKAKMEQNTYWVYVYDLERYQSLLTELNRQYSIVQMTIARKFKKEAGVNENLYKKIDFYTSEKKDIERKTQELIELKDKLEIEINMFNDELTLVKSKMFESQQLMVEKVNEYNLYFTGRISFFTQNITVNEKDGILDLIDSKFQDELHTVFDVIKNYNTNVVWYDSNDRKNLMDYYQYVLENISSNLENEWDKEFGHEILSQKKFEYYSYYVTKKLPLIYGTIHQFVLAKKFDETIQKAVYTMLDGIKEKLYVLVDLAFFTEQDIEFNPDIFDYDDKFKFRISQGIETSENVKNTFNGFIDNVKSYMSQKNLEFKTTDLKSTDLEKIDRIWNDMEKEYV